jgi:hypothetical protein
MRKTTRRHGNEKTIKDRTRNEEDNSRKCSMQHRPHQGGDNPIPKQEWRRRGDATKLSTKPAACERETSSMVTTQIRTRLSDVDDVHHLPSIPPDGYGISVHRSDRTSKRNQSVHLSLLGPEPVQDLVYAGRVEHHLRAITLGLVRKLGTKLVNVHVL